MWKFVSLLTVLFLYTFVGNAQQKLTLDECKLLAHENFPKLRQATLYEKITALKSENYQSNYLPQLNLNGQITYQSEVIEINIPLPGFEFDPVSKDQYKVYLDIKQNIWDGGVTKAQQELERSVLEANVQKLEIDVQQLNSIVDGYFFNILLTQKSIEVLKSQLIVLEQQIEQMKKAVSLGAARQKDQMKLEVEVLLFKQKVDELKSRKQTLLMVMGIIIGKELSIQALFELPEPVVSILQENKRPEIRYFSLQQSQLEIGDKVLTSLRKPKLFGFGQAGIGKPGFNMLKNEFSPYYLIGVGVNWKVIDWKNTKRNKMINDYNRQMISILKDDFLQKQQMQITDAVEKIAELEHQLINDQEIVKIREAITQSAQSEFQNGTINSTDYLLDLNDETRARINFELHKIQLIQAKTNLNTLMAN